MLSNTELFRIVQNGIPETGMPAFHELGVSQIRTVVSYLRTLQGRTGDTKLPGDPIKGKAIFFGKGGCAGCHMIGGRGGFIATDLSSYGSSHSASEIRDAITNAGGNSSSTKQVVVTTSDGHKYAGLARNEDNFSLQLQTSDGAFYFFNKSELQDLERKPESLMPADYGSTLSKRELDDLIGFLISVAKTGDSGPAPEDSE